MEVPTTSQRTSENAGTPMASATMPPRAASNGNRHGPSATGTDPRAAPLPSRAYRRSPRSRSSPSSRKRHSSTSTPAIAVAAAPLKVEPYWS